MIYKCTTIPEALIMPSIHTQSVTSLRNDNVTQDMNMDILNVTRLLQPGPGRQLAKYPHPKISTNESQHIMPIKRCGVSSHVMMKSVPYF